MSKEKVDKIEEVTQTQFNISKEIIKKFGQSAFINGQELIERPKEVISVSPKLDIILGGGIPGGSVVTLAGNEKSGKMQPLDAILYTKNGPIQMGNVKIGDKILDNTGMETTVKNIFKHGIQDVYKILFKDGSSCECGLDHLWTVLNLQKSESKRYYIRETIDTKTIINNRLRYALTSKYPRYKYAIDICSPVQFNSKNINIHPYLLGVLIGDGCLRYGIGLTNESDFLLDKVRNLLPNGYILKKHNCNKYGYTISFPTNPHQNIFIKYLKEYKLYKHLSKNKFIPDDYKYNSIEIRKQILQGLLDTDGYCDPRKHTIEYSTSSYQLAKDVQFIVQSLGGTCTIVERTTSYTGSSKKFISYRCAICFHDNTWCFTIPYKQESTGIRKYHLHRTIINIEKTRSVECQCIEVDNDTGLYLTDEFIVTHNTITALHIASKCQQKNRPIFFLDIEGRLKSRDLLGIKELKASEINIIKSYKGKILLAEDFLTIAIDILSNIPRSVVIMDSVSQLCTEKEFNCGMGEQQRAPGAILLAQFCKKIANIVPVNDNIIIMIQHLIANTSGYGASLVASGGRKIKYSMDIGLITKSFKLLRPGNKDDDENIPPYGQEVVWQTISTAFVAPGQKTTSSIRFGLGIDEIKENIQLGIDFGLITQAASWLDLTYLGDNAQKIQGQEKLYQFYNQPENSEAYLTLQNKIKEICGINHV